MKYTAWFLGGLVVLITAGLVALHTPAGRRFVLSQVTTLLASRQITFSTDELRYNLLDLSVDLRNLRVHPLDRADLPTFATIARLQIDLGLFALLRGSYVVETGHVDGVVVHYFIGADGRDNLPRTPAAENQPPADTTSEPIDYLISQLTVADARLRYENQAQMLDVSLPVQSISIDGQRLTGRHNVTLASGGGEIRFGDRLVGIERVAGTVDLGRDDLNIDDLQLVADGMTARVNGALRQFAMPELDMRAAITVDAARAATLARVNEPIAGRAEIDAHFEGPVATGAVTLRLNGSDLQYRTLTGIQLDAQGRYDLATRIADVVSLVVNAPFGGLSATGTVATADSGDSRVNLQMTTLNTMQVMQAFSLPYLVGSRVSGNIQAAWPGLAYEQTSGNGTLTLAPTGPGRGIVPIGGRIDVQAQDGRGTARITALQAAGVQVDGRITTSTAGRLGGAVDARIADIGRTLASAEVIQGQPRGSFGADRVAGSATIATALGGTLDSPRANAQVSVPAIRIGASAPAAVTAVLDYNPAALQISRADLSWQDARAHVDGRVNLTGAQALDLRVTADALEVTQILSALGQESPNASGRLSLNAIVGGRVAAPSGTVNLQGTDLSAYREVLGALNASATLLGREVVLDALTLDKPQEDGDGRLTLSGRYNLDQRAYAFTIDSDDLRIVSAVLPNGRTVTGELSVTGEGSGTVAAPTADLELVINELELDARPLGRIAIDSHVENGSAQIDASADRFDTRASATIGVASPYPSRVTVQIDGLDLTTLPLEINTSLEGTLRARVDATADLSEATRGTATMNIDDFAGAWNGRPFGLDMPALITYAAERLQIDRLSLSAQDSRVTIEGEIPLTPRAGEGLVLLDARANLATLAQYAPAGTEVAANGSVTMSGTIRGTTTMMVPEIDIAIDEGLLLTPAIEPGVSDLTLRARIGDGSATIEQLTAAWGAARLQLTALLPFEILPPLPVALPRANGPATVMATIEGLDPASIPGAPDGLGGRISMEARAETSSADVRALEGDIVFPELQLLFNGLTLDQTAPSTIKLQDGFARFEQFDLSGSIGRLRADGTVGLTATRPMDIQVSGQMDIGIASVFVDGMQAQGQGIVEIAAAGTPRAPDVSGFASVEDGTIVLDSPNVAANGVWARVDFHGREAILSQLIAELNGGSLTGWGSVAMGAGDIPDIDIGLNTDDFAFDAPLDLRSLSDANLRITRRDEEILVNGEIIIEEAGLTGDINFDTGLLAAISARRTIDLTEERNPLLERVRFDVGVQTATPVLLENNVAQAELEADLRVLGTPYETGLSGRLTLLEGGEVVLNERRYQVERGGLTFVDERRIAPVFDLRLNTSAQAYDITLSVTGPLSNTETSLTSDPVLPEPDIMALLVTGRTLNEMRGEEYDVAREQVLSYLTGRVGSSLGRGLERATGLSTVRLEPNLIANETDPSARLTVGQDLTGGLSLVYSTSLANSSDQIWTARYDVNRRFQARGVRQSDNSYRFDIRHDVRFGGRPAPRRIPRQRRIVTAVDVQPGMVMSEMELRDLLDIQPGSAFDFFAARSGAQAVEQKLADRGYLQARVRLRRMIEQDRVRLTLAVVEGPRVDIEFIGSTPPNKVRDDVRRQWLRGVFDVQRIDDGQERLKAWLMQDGYFQPTIQSAINDLAPDRRHVTFTIEPGPQYRQTDLAFQGASGVPAETLQDIITSQDLKDQLFTDPVVVTELLERYYREQGFLTAAIDGPRFEYAPPVARIVLDVREGPQFMVREVRTSGNRALEQADILRDLPVVPGEPFLPVAAENALNRIRDVYWMRGYNDIRSDYDLTILPGGRVDVAFTITEGPQTVVVGIDIQGRERTATTLVTDELEVGTQQPLDLTALGRSRQNLYNTGAFSLVDVTRTDAPTATMTNGTAASTALRPVQLTVSVREVQPFQLRYGVSYDTERGVGGIFDVSAHNTIGKARVLGLQSRYDAQVREGRLYLSQPSLRTRPVQTIASAYVRNESNPETEITDAFDINRRGMSVQQERKLRNRYVWSYGFRYERVFTSNVIAAGEPTATVSPVTATLTREARDEVLDASSGSFIAHAFAFSPAWFGVDQPYWKYSGQYFHYIPLRPPQRQRFTNEIIRPRLVFATGVRLGLARGIGGDVPASERFFAGGSTTLRGFAQNAVGPIGPDRVPAGGNLMLVLNNELRFPLVSIFDGVGFLDIGNNFSRISNFSLTDLREAAGIGLRVRTPWFLLRGDYGVALDPRPGESRSRFFFSIGQAF